MNKCFVDVLVDVIGQLNPHQSKGFDIYLFF